MPASKDELIKITECLTRLEGLEKEIGKLRKDFEKQKRELKEELKKEMEELLIRLCFEEEIDENSLFLAASLTYFFVVLYACLTEAVDRYFGVILILTSIMIVWHFRDKRKEIRRKYEKRIESLLKSK